MPKFCLLGQNISHSLSPWLHQNIAQLAGYAIEYELQDIEASYLRKHLSELLKAYDGCNITIPYKTEFNELLKNSTMQADCVQAANTLVVSRKNPLQSIRHNTDVAGAHAALVRLLASSGLQDLQNMQLYVLGSGGAARALTLAACELGVQGICFVGRAHSFRLQEMVTQLARAFPDIELRGLSYSELQRQEPCFPYVVVHATPCGSPAQLDYLPCSSELLCQLFAHHACRGAFDLVYTPSCTHFLKLARSFDLPVENGLAMLIVQALEAQRAWGLIDETHPLYDPDFKQFLDILLARAYEYLGGKHPLSYQALAAPGSDPVLITGFMGAGKSSLLQAVQKELDQRGLPVFCFDLDEELERRLGMSFTCYFEAYGEQAFRAREAELLQTFLSYPQVLIATGGGTLIDERSYQLMRAYHAQICYLDIEDPVRCFERLIRAPHAYNHRPLLSDLESFQRLYKQRAPYYFTRSQHFLNAWAPLEQLVHDVVSLMSLQTKVCG